MKRNKSIIKRAIIVIIILSIIPNNLKSQTNFIWGKQFGNSKDLYVLNHVNDDKANIYVAGKTSGIMDKRNYGKNDGFLTKIDSSDNILWSRQFGTPEEEDVQWCAIDNKGCVYITGSTTGDFKKYLSSGAYRCRSLWQLKWRT